MNAALPEDHPSIDFYDSDYPARDGELPENFDATTELQGVAADVDRFCTLAEVHGSPVLELCCGTGRVGLALARAKHPVVGVDISQRMLDRFAERIAQDGTGLNARITLHRQDVTQLDLPQRGFPLCIIPFNSLLCITSREAQIATLRAAAQHLAPGGRIVIDVVNPLAIPLSGDPAPKPFLQRRRISTGNRYTRFAAMGPLDAEQKQELYGWYDELSDDGLVRRTFYRMHWRLIFRHELELMLRLCGYHVEALEGGHRREPWTPASRKLFVIARGPARHAECIGGMDVV